MSYNDQDTLSNMKKTYEMFVLLKLGSQALITVELLLWKLENFKNFLYYIDSNSDYLEVSL